jgi:dihydrofolate synthase/folylpolyglutamate synthase
MEYKEAVDYLYGLQRHGIKLGLSNTLSLMDILGNPHQSFRSIHIAGTNGKGSTAAMIASILQTSGLKVGLYTSPHLVSFTERIRINGVTIPEERVADLVSTLNSELLTLNSLSPTFFEFTTAMAFQYFDEEDVDIAVIEVGMGGRLDATNVIIPMVSIITNIGYDHQEFLGSTLAEISREKAGIIKNKVPVISANNSPEVIKVIERRSEENESKLYIFGRDFRAEHRSQVTGHRSQILDYYGIKQVFKDLELSLLGHHQIVNASLALAATEIISIGIELEESAIRKGLKEARWEGRLEVLSRNPTILLDGSHNEEAASALRRALEEIFLPEHDRLFLIVGMMKDKNIRGFLKTLAPLAWEVIVTKADYERAASVASLSEVAERYNPRVKTIEKVSDALEYAVGRAKSYDLICVTGSLYTIGEIKGIGKDLELRG